MEHTYSSLYDKLSRLQWLLHRHHMITHAQRGPMGDTSRGQGRVLAMLKMQADISTKDLSYLLGIRQQSLNELLNKLEKVGYIERKPSEADKRVMVVHLTEAGRDAQPESQDYGDIFNCLDTEELGHFGLYLDRVLDALEARIGSDSDEESLMHWMRAARSRMGDEQFERLMDARRCGPHFRPQFAGAMHPSHHDHPAHFQPGGYDERPRGSHGRPNRRPPQPEPEFEDE